MLPLIKDIIGTDTQLKDMLLNDKILRKNREANRNRYNNNKNTVESLSSTITSLPN